MSDQERSTCRQCSIGQGFNPRTHEGCDRAGHDIYCETARFQSTHPRGVRRQTLDTTCYTITVSIQSPTRGATVAASWPPLPTDVSIHAPTRGATCFTFQTVIDYEVSIHAPTRGATISADHQVLRVTVSIHAPTRGATCSCLRSLQRYACFNPRTHEGCDGLAKQLVASGEFQSTHPRGVRLSSIVINCNFALFQSTHPRGVRRVVDVRVRDV